MEPVGSYKPIGITAYLMWLNTGSRFFRAVHSQKLGSWWWAWFQCKNLHFLCTNTIWRGSCTGSERIIVAAPGIAGDYLTNTVTHWCGYCQDHYCYTSRASSLSFLFIPARSYGVAPSCTLEAALCDAEYQHFRTVIKECPFLSVTTRKY